MKPIQVWAFHEAPEELRKLSGHGGDEDWLALVPKEYSGRWIPWLETGPFGACDVEIHELPDGQTVHIGAHS